MFCRRGARGSRGGWASECRMLRDLPGGPTTSARPRSMAEGSAARTMEDEDLARLPNHANPSLRRVLLDLPGPEVSQARGVADSVGKRPKAHTTWEKCSRL